MQIPVIDDVSQALSRIDRSDITVAVDIIEGVVKFSGTIFVVGNGGSATTASHFAVDLTRTIRQVRVRPAGVRSLVDSSAALTCIANDHGFEDIFRLQLSDEITHSDLLVCFSVSGTSRNILLAQECALARGARVLLLTSNNAPAVSGDAFRVITVPSQDPGVVETVHLALAHSIVYSLKSRIDFDATLMVPNAVLTS